MEHPLYWKNKGLLLLNLSPLIKRLSRPAAAKALTRPRPWWGSLISFSANTDTEHRLYCLDISRKSYLKQPRKAFWVPPPRYSFSRIPTKTSRPFFHLKLHKVTKRGNIGNLKYLSQEVNMQRCVRTKWNCSVLTQSYYPFNQPLGYETNKKSKHGGAHYVWKCLVSLCCCQFENFELHQASLWTENRGGSSQQHRGRLAAEVGMTCQNKSGV